MVFLQKVRLFENVNSWMSRPEKTLWEPCGGKNGKKYQFYCLGGPPGHSFTPARARYGPDFTLRGRRVEASQLVKGQSENIQRW
jgi:hypothetical protein